MKNKKILKFISWLMKFHKACDLLELWPNLNLIDMHEFYLVGWDAEELAAEILRNG